MTRESAEMWVVDGNRVSHLKMGELDVVVFRTGIHWTYRIECKECGLSRTGPLMATRKDARAVAFDLATKDQEEGMCEDPT